MQKDGRGQDAGSDVAPIDDLIKGVQLPGEVEAGKDKRSQAQNVEVHRAWRADPAVVDEQSNQQIDYAHHVLVIHRAIDYGLAHHYVRWKLHVAATDQVFRLIPNDDVLQDLGNVGGFADGISGDLKQDVPVADSGVLGFATRGNVQGDHRVLTVGISAVHPDHAIVGEPVEALLAEVNGRAAHRRHCKDEQQRTDELRLEIPQVCLSARTTLGRVLSRPVLGEHLKGQVDRLNLTMRIQHLHTENKRVRFIDFVFGSCHYRKVYLSRKLNPAKEYEGLSESY